MREIIFRGKRIDNGEWVYGFYWTNNLGNHFIRETQEPNGKYVVEDYEVTLDTIGQFTGITDRNGTKIFEHDVVSTDLGRPYLIVLYREGCFMFNCCDGEGDFFYDIILPILDEEPTVYKYGVVIGNLQDDPKYMGEY